ncbi:hypothetical protein Tco_0134233 [Tanacetum coccineum]
MEGSATPSDMSPLILLQTEIERSLSLFNDIIQKAHVKWDIEGDENSKFFHGLINQKRRNQMINGIMVEGNWITNPCLIKDAFLQFYKRKFQAQDSQVTLEEIKEAVWDCGSSKAPGPDGYSFVFVKKYWGTIQKDLYCFIILANRLSKVIDKIVSKEQSAFIASRQILDGPVILSEIIEWQGDPLSLPFHLVMECLLMLLEESQWNMVISLSITLVSPSGSIWKSMLAGRCLLMFSYYEAFLLEAIFCRLGSLTHYQVCAWLRLGIYYLSIFRAPESVFKTWKESGLNFFWGSLKVSTLSSSKMALEVAFSSPNALWGSGHQAYHGQGKEVRYKNGCCGTRIRFWKDIWVGETPLFTSLGPNGTFTVKDARYRIDQNIIPTLAHATTWDKSIPRKIATDYVEARF